MTDEATPSENVATAAPVASPTPVVPGNPGQTQATVKRFQENPAEAEYVFSQLGYDQRVRQALDKANQAELRTAMLEAALEFGIPKDKMYLIEDTTPEGIMRRAPGVSELLKAQAATPPGATPPTDIPTEATPPAKAAGLPLPAVSGENRLDMKDIRGSLAQYFTANPLPKT